MPTLNGQPTMALSETSPFVPPQPPAALLQSRASAYSGPVPDGSTTVAAPATEPATQQAATVPVPTERSGETGLPGVNPDILAADTQQAPVENDPATQRILAAQNAPTAGGRPMIAAQAPQAPLFEQREARGGILSSLFGQRNPAPRANVSRQSREEPRVQLASAAGLARLAPNGLRTQHDGVDIQCLKPALVRLLKKVESHYGKPVVITSGYRSASRNARARGAKNSLHIYCAAADIQVEGVSKSQLATYMRSLPGRGGVGTYCHTNSVHIDIGPRRDWNWRCRR